MSEDSIITKRLGSTFVIELNRPHARNAVDSATARKLAAAFTEFDEDDSLRAAVFHGVNGTFCAGADLKEVSGKNLQTPVLEGDLARMDGSAPMGASYLRPSKPVIGAIAGHAVAGGLELSLVCDFRVADETAIFGVYCRRWGVPLIDGGTVRLPRVVGMGNALDMILTGRAVDAHEAKTMGLANYVVAPGKALEKAVEIADQLARFPQKCMLSDRQSAYDQWNMTFVDAMLNENRLGHQVLSSGETVSGATRFAGGKGRGGSFADL
ncbi:MAG: crotonase/enoyl-CoA hydratase family protein [Pseudomonadota bacterium]